MKRKVILSFLLALVMAVTSVMPAMAEEVPVAESEDGYLENHYQIDLTNLDIEINDGDLEVEVQDGLSKREEREATEDAEMLEFLVDRYEDDLVDFIEETAEEEEDRVMVAICMTECPLELNEDGEFDRIEADDTATEDSSFIREAAAANYSDTNATGKAESPSNARNFSLVTAVSRGTSSTKNKAGEYLYYATSRGVWSGYGGLQCNSPDLGDDYIIQSTPGPITSDTLYAQYGGNRNAKAGDYYRCDGGDRWVEYAVRDKALLDSNNNYGLKRCTLTTNFRAKKSSSTRKINSYYVHTWKKMSVSVSVGASSSTGTPITVTPTSTSKSWKVYSYVCFNF